MHKLAELCVKRPVFATMLVLSLVVVGAFSYFTLGVDLLPKVDLPIVTVSVSDPGASPEEIEIEISKKIEDAVNTISGIDELRSNSSEGVAQVVVTFDLSKDGDVAADGGVSGSRDVGVQRDGACGADENCGGRIGDAHAADGDAGAADGDVARL